MNLRRTFSTCLLAALAPAAALPAADYTIQAGSTDVTVYVTLKPDAGGGISPDDLTGVAYNDADLKVYYVRDGESVEQITTATQTVTGAHANGGWVELSDTNAMARYRLDLPDEVCEPGVRHVKVMATYDAGQGISDIDIDLVGYNPTAAALPANVTQISGDSAAADNAELFFDGTGYGELVHRTIVDSAQSSTEFVLASGSSTNDVYNGCRLVVVDETNPLNKWMGTITDYVGSTGVITILWDGPVPASSSDNILYILAPSTNVTDRTRISDILADTADMQPKLGTISDLGGGATLAANLADIEGQTDDIGTAGAGLTALASQSSVNTIDGILDDIFTAFELDDTVYRLTENAVSNVDSGVAPEDIWTYGGTRSLTDKAGFSLAADQSGVTIGTVSTLTGHTPQTGDAFAVVDSGTFGNSAIKTALDSKASQSSVDDLEVLLDDLFEGAPTFAEAMDAHGYTSERADKIDRLAPSLLLSTTVDGAPASQTVFALENGPPDDYALNGALVIFTDASDASQKAVGLVRSYDQSTKTITLVNDPGIFEIGDDDQVDVIATGVALPLWLSGAP